MSFGRRVRALAVITVLVGAGCSNDSHTSKDAGSDGMVGVDAATGIPSCALEDRRECVPSQFYALQPLLEASTLGSDVTFTALDGDAVIAKRASGPDILARIFPWDSSTPAEVNELPDDFVSIDLTRISSRVFVIGCDATACRLIDRDDYEDGIREVEHSTLPLVAAPRGILEGRHYANELGGNWPCVVGEGLWCFDGTEWHVELAEESLAAATLLTPQVALATDGSVWFHNEDAGEWTPVPGLRSSQPRWVDQQRTNSVSRSGLLLDASAWAWINDDGTAEQCALATPYAALRVAPQTSLVVGLSSAGDNTVYAQWSEQTTTLLCTNPNLPLDSLVDIGIATCGILSNIRILTTDALWGTSACAIY